MSQKVYRFEEAILSVRGVPTTDQEALVLHGKLSAESLKLVEIPRYQRPPLSQSKIQELREPVQHGWVPEIICASREDTCEADPHEKTTYMIPGTVRVIDGQQRLLAALLNIQEEPGLNQRLDVMMFLGITEERERQLFKHYNRDRTPVKPGIILRNYAQGKEFPILREIHRMTQKDEGTPIWVLKGRVSWEDRTTDQELITARTLCKVMAELHYRFGAIRGTTPELLAKGLQQAADKIGGQRLMDNTKTFFHVVDECWNLADIAYKDSAAQIKGAFLYTLAFLLASCEPFWKGPSKRYKGKGASEVQETQLIVDKDWVKRLKNFKIKDPTVQEACKRGSGKSDWIAHKL